MSRLRLLILSYTNPLADPRVFRQMNFLDATFEITVAGLPPGPETSSFLPVRKVDASPLRKLWWAGMLLAGNSKPFLDRYQLEGKNEITDRFDLVLVNDADPLPLAFELADGAPVFFDAHEYYPREFDNSLIWNMVFSAHYTRLCHDFIPRCAGMSTVCDGLAAEYERQFGRRPIVIRNVSASEPLEPQKTGDKIRLIHHGVANPDRCLELMIEMMNYADERFSLDLMLAGSGRYWEKLRTMALAHPRIKFLPPVPMAQICSFINSYDLGVYLLSPNNFNNKHALPNKIFEFIQARLGVVIGPSPEMARIVEEYELGIVAEDFTPRSLADALNRLTTEAVMTMKNHANKAASVLNAANEMEKLRSALLGILEKGKN